ncbi:MAG: LOG family protein [Candidatus Peribacteraceae bacterium]|nr:LOG family protein [Candidatus Peribacteraceae bacterium]
MSGYRLNSVAKFKSGKVIQLSRSDGKAVEEKLDKAQQNYERLLEKSFPYHFFESYRITIFGSSAIEDENSPEFKFVEQLAEKLGEAMQVDIVTGGGGGLMLAANEGLENAKKVFIKNHKKVTFRNYGIRVSLPNEIGRNDRLDVIEDFENFSTRLEEFVRTSNAVYLAPGGFGTDLEAAMFVQLKQRWKIEADFPIIAHPFWKRVYEKENKMMFDGRVKNGCAPLIDAADKKLIQYSKSIPEIVRIFKKHHHAWQKLRKKVKWVK